MGPHRPNGGRMMAGVVAGFPAKTTPKGITVVAAYEDGPSYGGFELGYLGSIAPEGASAVPGRAPEPGHNEEIEGLIFELYEGVSPRLYLYLRVRPAVAPFKSLTIDGGTPLTSFSNWGHNGYWFSLPQTGIGANPIPAGSHTLLFL